MALYKLGLMTENEVNSWGDEQLLNGTESFDYISLLSLYGPGYCCRLPSYDFPAARKFTFIEEFALRATNLNLDVEEDRLNFILWVSTECMGLDINIPEVKFGYLVDHYFHECDDAAFAHKYFNDQLRFLVEKNSEVFDTIWASIG